MVTKYKLFARLAIIRGRLLFTSSGWFVLAYNQPERGFTIQIKNMVVIQPHNLVY